MVVELTILIAGEAGQGMQTIGFALSKMFKNAGLNIFSSQDYMSRVRGGNNFFQLRVSRKPLHCPRQKSDIIIALDKPSVAIHINNLAKNGIMVLDRKKSGITEDDKVFFDAPFYDIAMRLAGNEMFSNSAACGVIAAMTGIEFERMSEVIKFTFLDKGEEIVQKNIEVAKEGYEFAKNNFKQDRFRLKAGKVNNDLIMNGNDAIALAAIRAGCKFYSAYPMTPSTSIMNVVAHYAKKFNIVVEQAEDEIAAINMAIGASFAGARVMTASSGGGFALMVEGVSLAAMTETPVVVALAQRPAPATGFPTRTEQADLEFLLHAGHGEFAKVIYSPGTIEQAFYLTIKAFNMAEKYQIPTFVMTDQYLADSTRNLKAFDLGKVNVRRYIISKEESKNISNYKRYALNASGISPRAIPSWINDVVYADSDEHTEEGHITESADIRKKMVEKRLYKKMKGLLREVEKPTAYKVKGAKFILIGFGSTYGVLKEACDTLTDKKIGFIHLSQVWPFPSKDIVKLLAKKKNIFTVENNAAAQLARLLRRETGIQVKGSILKYDGRPFDLDGLTDEIKKIWK